MVRQQSTRRAFSFAEVMFAVIILGIGFIMIAALFPVAIKQSKSTADETSSAAFARAAANYVDSTAINTNFSSIGPVCALPTIGINTSATEAALIRGNMISQTDPRYAWVPFYLRTKDPVNTTVNRPYAELIMICVQATNKSVFTNDDTLPLGSGANPRSNLQGRPVQVEINKGSNGDADLIGFQDKPVPSPSLPNDGLPGASAAVAEGCFVIIRNDTAVVSHKSRLNGQIYRVGVRRPEMDGQPAPAYTNPVTGTAGPSVTFTGMQVWELVPGSDFKYVAAGTYPEIDGIETATDAWIVGRGMTDLHYPAPPAGPTFDGPAMDVSAYSTFIYCKQ